MALLKSILTGVGVAMAAAMVTGLFLQGAQYRAAMSSAAEGSAAARPEWHLWLLFGVSVVAFAAGFWSQYRKVS